MFAKGNRSPGYLARTFAVGFSAGMFMIYGQMFLCFVAWLIMDRWLKRRFSVLIASLLTLLSISNPLTMPFVLYLYYLTGQLMLGRSIVSFTSFLIQAKDLLMSIEGSHLWDGIKIAAVGIGWPITLGSAPWHIVMGFVGYSVGTRVYWRLQKIIEKKKISQNERKAGGDRRVTEY